MNDGVNRALTLFSANYKERAYNKGEVIIRADDEPTGIYLVKSGVVKMSSISEDGQELGVNIFKVGTFFPMTWAISEISNSYNFQSLTPTKLVRIPKKDFIQFLKANPDVLFDLTRRILVGLDGLLFNVRYLLAGSSISKVAVILYMLVKRFGIKNGKQIEVGLALTHQDISHFTGLTRETTTLAINKLVEEKVVIQKQGRIIVRDIQALKNSFEEKILGN
jgi:CRP-like cAMP-binding protein